MADRKEYFKKYYQANRKVVLKAAKNYYKENRKECLSNHHKYYKENREDILAQKKMKALTYKGHAYSIWHAVKKYAKLWNLPICDFSDFWDEWSDNDPTYKQLWEEWKDSGYNEYRSPVVMRKIKKQGFVPENLKWDVKNNYSWWNEDSTIFKNVSSQLEEQQKERNKRSKEWRKKIREQFKAKQKDKK